MDPKFVVNLQGRDYPTWPGILAEAHERGLTKLEVEIVQVPDETNGHVAICQAVATFQDGQKFSDIGDANPKNTNARVATALLRMASTRAKGRCLRDACNIGQTMLEEISEGTSGDQAGSGLSVGQEASRGAQPASTAGGKERVQRAAATINQPASGLACSNCGDPVTDGRAAYCRQNKLPITHALCVKGD